MGPGMFGLYVKATIPVNVDLNSVDFNSTTFDTECNVEEDFKASLQQLASAGIPEGLGRGL